MSKIIKIIMGGIAIILVFFIAIGMFVPAPVIPESKQEVPISRNLSEKHIVGDSWFGATSKKELEEITRYAAQKDDQAFKETMITGIANKKLTFFKNGEEVYLMDTAIFSGLVKVRRKGETVGYWTYLEAVK